MENPELEIELIDVNHSGFNREVHQDNLLRGLAFQTKLNGSPFEYRAKEISSTGKVLEKNPIFTDYVFRSYFRTF